MSARLLAAWMLMMAGMITIDVANDTYWLELVGGLAFLGAWLLLTKEDA